TRMYAKEVAPDRRTLRTVLRDTFSSRTISLIDLPRTKCSRLIRPIVSTTSIPRHPLASPSGSACTSLRNGGQSWTPITPLTGSIFHAETHPPLRRRASDVLDVLRPRALLAHTRLCRALYSQ